MELLTFAFLMGFMKILKTKSIIQMIISMEFLSTVMFYMMLSSSMSYFDIQTFTLVMVGFAVSETAVILTLLVLLIQNFGSFSAKELSMTKY